MNETSLSALLERMPVSWWEADEELRIVASGGGAFNDFRVAQKFLDTLRAKYPQSGDDGEISRRQVTFGGRLFEVASYRERLPDGSPAGVRGLAMDVSAPAVVQRRHDPFADFTPAAAFIRDGQGRYLWANPTYAQLYGTTPEAIIGRRVTDFDTPADAELFRTLDGEILSSGKPVRHTLTFHRPDGSTGRAVGHRFPVVEGSQACVAGIYMDITEHTRALSQRRAAEADLQALRDHSGLPCALLSPGGRIQQISTAAAELLHVPVSALIGRPAHGFLAPAEGLDALHSRWNDLIARRRRRIQTSASFVDARGYRWRARLLLTSVSQNSRRARSVWAVLTHQGLPHRPHPPLTAAQVRILALLAAGCSNGEIASSLKLSRQTVDYHLSRLRGLLEAPTRLALVGRAYVLGILDPQTWPPRSATATHPLSST
ncbi:PAS domain-containing protein [Streptomyces sp. H27-D2]|uniref:PAS domain-containing protein n=1 Tax=Streptomyces sp. H27-D2 TaxID=3046304 RepID=UPI002DB8E217|nr:PAS domain-containing protein [Streptomyces sp. H27-D2]MEC4018631.1 PAS domain-containing protein [Streptomyces sp. H27-D2]